MKRALILAIWTMMLLSSCSVVEKFRSVESRTGGLTKRMNVVLELNSEQVDRLSAINREYYMQINDTPATETEIALASWIWERNVLEVLNDHQKTRFLHIVEPSTYPFSITRSAPFER